MSHPWGSQIFGFSDPIVSCALLHVNHKATTGPSLYLRAYPPMPSKILERGCSQCPRPAFSSNTVLAFPVLGRRWSSAWTRRSRRRPCSPGPGKSSWPPGRTKEQAGTRPVQLVHTSQLCFPAIYIYTYIYIYTCMYICMYIHVYECIYIYM